jgi:Zn-dependent M28 family amino/carboxypeptidase
MEACVRLVPCVFAALLCVPPGAVAQESPDLVVVDRIKAEAFDRSQVVETLRNLADVHGPRLTASPQFDRAAEWTMERLRGYGLANVHLEAWGPFGRSWEATRYSVEQLEPSYVQVEAAPLAWGAATAGPVEGVPLLAPLEVSFKRGPKGVTAEFETYKKAWAGRLRGRIVLLSAVRPERPRDSALFSRLTAEQLGKIAAAPDPAKPLEEVDIDDLRWPERDEDVERQFMSMSAEMIDRLFDRLDALAAERGAWFASEGVAAILQSDDRAREGLLDAEAAGSFKSATPAAPATFVLTSEQYGRIARLAEKKNPVRLRVALETRVSSGDVDAHNVIAEIPGGARQGEIVMIGAHFDSWHTGTGATDNGAGSAVVIEVMRILKTLGLRLDRTVRLGLWSGEEQGLFGSRAYVAAHFGSPAAKSVKPEHALLSGYFNLDNGSGKIRGVYLQRHEAMRPIFERWLSPFQDLGVTTISIRDTGGTDHLSFTAAGLPGFQFIQDPLDYDSLTHHTSADTLEHAVPADLMQAAAVIATVVYEAANRPERLPRRP